MSNTQAVNMTSPLLHFAGKYQDFVRVRRVFRIHFSLPLCLNQLFTRPRRTHVA
jgi:hypothetical protein